jgi:Tfp pilus assembly protein PilO
MKKIYYLKLLHEYEFVVGGIIILCIVIIMTFTVVLPNYFKIREIYRQQNALYTKLEALKKKDFALSSINRENYEAKMPKLLNVLPVSKDFVALFLRLDRLQQENGVTVHKADFQLGVLSTSSAMLNKFPNTNSFVIPMSFDVSGDLSQMKLFLENLANLSGRYISLDDVKWTFKSGNIRASLTGKTYFYPDPKLVAKLEAPLKLISKDNENLLERVISAQPELLQDIGTDNIPVGKKNLFN